MDKDLSKSTSATEDTSPLTTSTESETFDTWTVITDQKNDEIQFIPLTPEKSDDDDEIAVDAEQVDVLKAADDLIDCRYNDIDDLSDGISIISESESAGRISPHPELRKQLSELNMRFIRSSPMTFSMPNASLNYDNASQRFHGVEPLPESSQNPRPAPCQLVEPTDVQPTSRYRLRGLFYIGALLAVLAFISKVKYDAFESVHGAKTDLLQEKVNDLELKNNLMRAEIDILAKQVNYLTTLSENKKYTSPPSSKQPKNTQQGEKKIKVWPGNGNTIEEVHISPKDLKKPFKCDGHNNVDIAGMCIELPLSTKSVVDSIGEKVRVVIDENEYLSNLEKVVDRMAQLAENPFAEQIEKPAVETPPVLEQPKADYVPHEHKPDKYEGKNHEKRDNYKKHNFESKERNSRRDRSNEDHDDSAERYKKTKDYKKYDKRSSTEYENSKREADGHWHEKMMQHRENSRKNNEKYRHDNNWYIERGDSREQARMTENKQRGSGQR